MSLQRLARDSHLRLHEHGSRKRWSHYDVKEGRDQHGTAHSSTVKPDFWVSAHEAHKPLYKYPAVGHGIIIGIFQLTIYRRASILAKLSRPFNLSTVKLLNLTGYLGSDKRKRSRRYRF